MSISDIAAPYAEGLTRRQWTVLGITMLFWLFDGYETYALLLTIGPSLRELLPANELSILPRVAAYLMAGESARFGDPWTIKKGSVWWLRHRPREGRAEVQIIAVRTAEGL